ncbi:MAG: phosphatase PAP2 family protein [Lysobacterales bacterium]
MNFTQDWFQHWIAGPELRVCQRLNACCQYRGVRSLFRLVSKVGDGYVWYALMLALLLFGGERGLQTTLRMALVGLVSVLLYRTLKRLTRRPRPYARHQGIAAHIAAMDEFSFPSGHTLHAVSFSLVAISWFPGLSVVLLPFTLLVAASRVILGVHYPSDVLAATVLGVLLALPALAPV